MPLPPFAHLEKSRRPRGRPLRSLPALLLLGLTLGLANLGQVLSLVLLPFSPERFRRVNRWLAGSWGSLAMALVQRIHGVRFTLTGDDVPPHENALVTANHQSMADIPAILSVAGPAGRIGDLKWFVKRSLKPVPGIGWGLWFLDCIFLDRNWTRDRSTIEATFAHVLRHRVPLWLVSFSEGTRISGEKLRRSQEFARKRGLLPLRHVLVPRPRGFAASVEGLRDHLHAVYDLTVGYVQGIPSLWDFAVGRALSVHVHVRRWPLEALPSGEEALSQWLMERFAEKDRLLEHHYTHGGFA